MYYISKRETRRTTHFDLGVADAKGRAIGAAIKYCDCSVEEGNSGAYDDERQGWRQIVPDGAVIGDTIFTMEVHATRNGTDYGACQRTQRFTTAAARDAARDRYLDGARKRAAAKAK